MSRLILVLLCLALASCSKTPDATADTAAAAPSTGPAIVSAATRSTAAEPVAQAVPGANTHEDGIAWRRGDVDAAFAEARQSKKPVFLYWGATWCPPCNQVKATIFNRQDFIERSRAFVPIYLDGDTPSAQKYGDRFKVSGYPTMLLLTSEGKEITRLPGEVDAHQYLSVLELGMSAGRSARDVLEAAKKHQALGAAEWDLLSYYSWETDDQALVAKGQMAPTLLQLAKQSPAALPAHDRLMFIAAAVAAESAKPAVVLTVSDRDALRTVIERELSDPVRARRNFDLVTNVSGSLVDQLSAGNAAQRATLVDVWGKALDRLSVDMTLSTTDRISALDAKVKLLNPDSKEAHVSAEMADQLRGAAAAADAATTNAYERQAVIDAVGSMLADAGLLDDSDRYLRSELTRSHEPYYFMTDLAENAATRGDTAGALDWHAKAYAAAEGPATRLQWGTRYLVAMIKTEPDRDDQIAALGIQVVSEIGATKDAFYERNEGSMHRIAKALAQWNHDGKHSEAVSRIEKTLNGVCEKIPATDPDHARCAKALLPPALERA